MNPHTTYRHSTQAKRLLAKIAHHWGLTRTATLEIIIRAHAIELGLVKQKEPKKEEELVEFKG